MNSIPMRNFLQEMLSGVIGSNVLTKMFSAECVVALASI